VSARVHTYPLSLHDALPILVALMVVVPAFGFFQYEKASVARAWHEPVWRPTLIGICSLFVALGIAVGWHGLRLAFYLARLWTGRSEEHTSELQSREKLVCRL